MVLQCTLVQNRVIKVKKIFQRAQAVEGRLKTIPFFYAVERFWGRKGLSHTSINTQVRFHQENPFGSPF